MCFEISLLICKRHFLRYSVSEKNKQIARRIDFIFSSLFSFLESRNLRSYFRFEESEKIQHGEQDNYLLANEHVSQNSDICLWEELLRFYNRLLCNITLYNKPITYILLQVSPLHYMFALALTLGETLPTPASSFPP